MGKDIKKIKISDLNRYEDQEGLIKYSQILLELLKYAASEGYVKDENSFPMIPELLGQARDICLDLLKWGKEELHERRNNPLFTIYVANAAVYAGMGAVYFWDVDWPSLSQKGVLQTLFEPRGSLDFDEYVTDQIGIKWGSPASKKLREFVDICTFYSNDFSNRLFETDKSLAIPQLIEGIMAMYCLGMSIEMHRLGMD